MKKRIAVFLSVIIAFGAVIPSAADSTDNYRKYSQSIESAVTKSEILLPLDGFNSIDGAETELKQEYEGKSNVLIWKENKGRIEAEFFVNETAKYIIRMTYMIPENGDADIELSLLLDNTVQFKEGARFSLKRCWADAGEIRKDGLGNEFAPEQRQLNVWNTVELCDASGLYNDAFEFYLSAGTHKISFDKDAPELAIADITLGKPQQISDYENVIKKIGSVKDNSYSGIPITIQGEDTAYKSANYLVSQSDRTSCDVTPNDSANARINYIGGNNWSSSGDSISWKINVPESGYYKLSWNYRQSYVMNGSSYRKLRIDGEIPFSEAASVEFPYCYNWKTACFENEDGTPYLLYLTEGDHTLSLEVTLGEISELAVKLSEQISVIGVLYREMTMITGSNPDTNRDYDLFGQIPKFEERLTETRDALEELASVSEEIAGKKGGSNASIMRNMANVMDMMLKYKYQAQNYQKTFYDNFSSISAWLYDLPSMPIDIDCFILSTPEDQDLLEHPNFFEKLAFSAKRLLISFSADYNSISKASGYEKSLILWVNWGRDQVQILNHLIQSKFSEKINIGVNVRMTNASLVQAILSGNGPDVYLHLSRTQPINLAMRGALADLSQFKDYDEVIQRFMPAATQPYTYNGGTYALPDTQTFYMMFYRTDILEEYDLSVPKTWDDFINIASVLMRNNLEVGLPYVQITNMSQVDLGTGALNLYPTLVAQRGRTIYSEDLKRVEMLSSESLDAFKMLTDFYTKYSFPKSYDFYNRFRSGLMPIGIQSYTMYSTLKSAASEINGLWEMAELPGYVSKDGQINNTQVSGGTGAVIFKDTSDLSAAWEFLKWWTDADTQYSYSREVEAVLGIVARNTSATVEAVSRLSWDSGAYDMLEKQWEKVEEWPEIPGGYYIPRAVDQAFWNVLNNGKSAKEMLLKWNSVVNLEIEEKRSQYEQ